MPAALFEILVILFLVLLNGLFAMSEMAVVSARKSRLQQGVQENEPGAGAALRLAEKPGRFLSTIQVGITLIGVLSGAIGGATLAESITAWLARFPLLAPYAGPIGIGSVVVLITYLSLVLGELAPKRLALGNPERIAAAIAGPMSILGRLLGPVVRLLNISTEAVLKLAGVRGRRRSPVTEEEIELMLEEGAAGGWFAPEERLMIGRVFRLADRRLSIVMTPRPEIEWLDVNAGEEEICDRLAKSKHSRLPVCEGELDHVLGVVYTKDLLSQMICGDGLDVRRCLRQAPFVPESVEAYDVLEIFRHSPTRLALVMDEYGGLQGLVTPNDLLQALVGEIPEPGEEQIPSAAQQADDSWLVDGMLPVDELADLLNVPEPQDLLRGVYETLSGLVMAQLGKIPSPGDTFLWEGYRFEVLRMERLRVEQVRITRAEAEEERNA